MGAKPHSNTNTTVDVLHIKTFTIEPMKGLRVLLGTFSDNNQKPKFRVVYHDHSLESPNVVSYDDMELPRDSDTHDIYRHFESYSQVPHTITVRFASQADKELCIG